MQLTQEKIDEIIADCRKNLRVTSIRHVSHIKFEIVSKFWLDGDFQKAREIGLGITSIGPKCLLEVEGHAQNWCIEIEAEYIGKHRIVMR